MQLWGFSGCNRGGSHDRWDGKSWSQLPAVAIWRIPAVEDEATKLYVAYVPGLLLDYYYYYCYCYYI